MREEREIIANCEACSKPIYDGDKYYAGPDIVYLCEEHAPSLSDVIIQHEEILSSVPWNPGELSYDSRSEMMEALLDMKHELAMSGDRKLLSEDSAA